MTIMLKTLMEKVDHMQEQTGNVNRETGLLRKNKKEMLEMENGNEVVSVSQQDT